MNARRSSAGREPFDPGRVRGGKDAPSLFGRAGGGPAVLTVSQLTRLVRGAIRKELPGEIHVTGELSNLARPAGGHVYFTLKDESSEVRCVMWQSSVRRLKFGPEDGLAVVATGTLDVYEPRGQYQFYVRRLEPRGVGALELAFRQLKERLGREGLFDTARKRPLPRFPQRIAVVTSLTGAAVRDVLKTIGRRFPCVHVFVYGARVQGEGAAEELADAIRRINRARDRLGGVDVLIVGRGGGSLEDLWAFNEEVVARAIFASEIPVVSAVGHEVDFTIADFVADVRAATPTAAAEQVVPDLGEVIAEINAQGHRLGRGTRRLLEMAGARLVAVERCEWFRDPVGRVRQRQQQIDEVMSRLALAMSRALSRRRGAVHEAEIRLSRVRPEALLARRRQGLTEAEHRLQWTLGRLNLRVERRFREVHGRLLAASPLRLAERERLRLDQFAGRLVRGTVRGLGDRKRAVETLAARLAASSHERVLNRGFSITRYGKRGKIVRQASDVREGDKLLTETAEGEIASRVFDQRQGELFE